MMDGIDLNQISRLDGLPVFGLAGRQWSFGDPPGFAAETWFVDTATGTQTVQDTADG